MTKKLLLADDSITIQKVIGIIFATEDYQLIVTDNGDEAYEKALREYPDLVIADVAMPGKDGFELCEAIKRDSRLPHTSVLLLPGTFEHFDEERAETVGADGWIYKPFESQALLDKVVQLMEAEPLRLDTVPEPAVEGPVAAPAEDVATEQPVDEAALGLEEMEEPAVFVAPGEETSPEDIWDAVSFEEEDLQGQAEVAAEPVLDENPEAELLETSPAAESVEEEPLDLTEEEPADFAASADEVDFSGGAEEPLELVDETVEPTAEISAFEEEPLDLSEEEVMEPERVPAAESDVVEESLGLAEEADESAEEIVNLEEEPLDLSEEEVVEAEGAPVPELDAPEEPLELAEEEIVAEPPVTLEEEVPIVEPLADEMVEEGEEILDLSDEDILEEEPLEELAEEVSTEEPEEEPLGLAEEAAVAEEPEYEAPVVEEPPADEAGAEKFEAQPEVVEDEGFYFDDAAAAQEEVAETEEPEPEPIAAAASIEQVEQQLRELSADELKDVVSKVAGPMIEKLASEMLAQIAWEVVPDLAEAMIREEIRKIKQSAE